jgi:hypothetical protein
MQDFRRMLQEAMARNGLVTGLGLAAGVLALALLQAGFYALLDETGLFDIAVVGPYGRRIVPHAFAFAPVLPSLILAALLSLTPLAGLLWQKTHSLKLTAAAVMGSLAILLAVETDGNPRKMAELAQSTATWYRQLRPVIVLGVAPLPAGLPIHPVRAGSI